ncbi:MAG: hypothetical protein ACFFD7_12935 [Candidatus Thorarchaeota archaeon]
MMFPKVINYRTISRRTTVIFLLIILLLIFSLYGNLIVNPTLNYGLHQNNPDINQISKDDYNAILSSEQYGLGNVTIDDLHFDYYQIGLVNDTEEHPLVDIDIFSFSLLYYLPESKVEYINTISQATNDNLNGTKKNSIVLKLNETLSVYYNNSLAGYLVYHTVFANAKLLEFYVDDGTSIIKLTLGSDYSINSKGYIIFHYENYFNKGPVFNFKMHLIWQYNVGVLDWTLDQREETPLIMTEEEQEFTSRFTYQFILLGYYILPDLKTQMPIEFISAAVTIRPPDRELLSYQDFIINGQFVNTNDHKNPDNSISIEIADFFKLNNSFISLNFTCTFGLKFEEPLYESWAVDRLVSGRNLRERIYIIAMLTGPRHIFLKNVSIYEPGILEDQTLRSRSLFSREVEFIDANASGSEQIGLKIFTSNSEHVNRTCTHAKSNFTPT